MCKRGRNLKTLGRYQTSSDTQKHTQTGSVSLHLSQSVLDVVNQQSCLHEQILQFTMPYLRTSLSKVVDLRATLGKTRTKHLHLLFIVPRLAAVCLESISFVGSTKRFETLY